MMRQKDVDTEAKSSTEVSHGGWVGGDWLCLSTAGERRAAGQSQTKWRSERSEGLTYLSPDTSALSRCGQRCSSWAAILVFASAPRTCTVSWQTNGSIHNLCVTFKALDLYFLLLMISLLSNIGVFYLWTFWPVRNQKCKEANFRQMVLMQNCRCPQWWSQSDLINIF